MVIFKLDGNLGLAILLMTLLAGFPGCRDASTPTPISPAATTRAVATPVAAVLAKWSGGDQAGAVTNFVLAFERHSDGSETADFRVFTMSEEDFAHLPESRREVEMKSLLDLSQNLRLLCVDLKNHADDALGRGDRRTADFALLAMKKLADDNSWPGVVELGRVTAKAIGALADQERQKLTTTNP